MRIFLTGGSGFVGHHLRKALVADEHQVVALVRRPQADEHGVTWVTGDIQDSDLLHEAMAGCQAVIHLVGIIREKGAATFARVHVAGTEHIVSAMQQLGISRLLQMSALGAGPKGPTEYFRTKWQAEELVRATGLSYTIFRPSIIFGPGDGFINTLVSQLRYFPVIPVIGAGDYTSAPISIYAVCAAFVQALSLDGETIAKTFELCGPQVLSYTQILDTLAAYTHIRKPRLHIKPNTMAMLLHLAGALHIALPITQDELQMLMMGSTCTEDSAQSVFTLPRITLAEGIKEYIRGRK